MEECPWLAGDRVRHYGHQYTYEATGSIVEVDPKPRRNGFGGTYFELLVQKDKGYFAGDPNGPSWWPSDLTYFVSRLVPLSEVTS